MINILIAEDDKLFSQIVAKAIFNVLPNANILHAFDGFEVLQMLDEKNVDIDIIIMDIDMPNKNGLTTAAEVLAINKNVKIICTSSYKSSTELMNMKVLGVSGFILKKCADDEYKDSIETVLKGELYYAPPIMDLLKQKGLIKTAMSKKNKIEEYHLTKSELEILKNVCENFTSEFIAFNAQIDIKTVEKHITNLYKKFDISDEQKTQKRSKLKTHPVVLNWFRNL